jgi:hypothetical protein
MLQCFEQRNDQKLGQNQNQSEALKFSDAFFQWFTEEEQALLDQLWEENKRIPQEVLTIETWRKWL